MTNVDIAIVFLVILVFVNYRLNKSILYPPFIFCSMWLLDLGLDRLNLVEMYPIHAETLAIVTAGAFLFSAGGVFALLVPRTFIKIRFVLGRNKIGQSTLSPQRSNLVKPLITFALAVGVLFLIRHTFAAAAQGAGSSFLERARNSSFDPENENKQFPMDSYILLWSIYAAVLFQLERRDRASWVMVGIAFIGCIFSTGRTTLLLLISALVCIHLIKTNRVSFFAAFKFVRWPLLAFMALWIGLFFTNKDTSAFGSEVGGLILLFLVNYIVGPVVALDYALRHPFDLLVMPHNTFKFLLSVASFLHLIQYNPIPAYNPYVPVPFPTNVYTIYRPYIADFGLYGALGVMMLIGLLHTLLYLKARTGSELSLYFFSLTLFPVIMVIFADQYSMFGSYIDILLFGSIYMLLRDHPLFRMPKISFRLLSQRQVAHIRPSSRFDKNM